MARVRPARVVKVDEAADALAGSAHGFVGMQVHLFIRPRHPHLDGTLLRLLHRFGPKRTGVFDLIRFVSLVRMQNPIASPLWRDEQALGQNC